MAASLRSTRSVAKAALSNRMGRVIIGSRRILRPRTKAAILFSVSRPAPVRLDRWGDRFPSRIVVIWQKMASTDVREGSGEAVVDIAAWLQRLGLEQYEQAFQGNDIDGEVLPELTAEDLIGLGVTSIGHRRKLLAAIAALGGKPADDTSAPATISGAADTLKGSVSSSAERRQLTVMFCDLVGSTPLS